MDNQAELLEPREERLNDVLGAYLEAEDAGWAPEFDDWIGRYPDLAADLRGFFVAQGQVQALAYPAPAKSSGSAAASVEPDTAPVRPNRNPADLRPIGEYEVHELIKEGGMGAVFKAWQKGAERWVALKRIKTNKLVTRGDVRRFRDEAEAAANLDHPNIVPIYEVGERDGQPFFSMKYFEHGSLQQHLPRFQKDHRAAVRLLSKVARAVHYAHQHGILHRDLKPANILLDAQEQPYVADFGLAKRLAPKRGKARLANATPADDDALTQGSTPRTAASPRTAADSASSSEPLEDVSYLAPEQADATQAHRPAVRKSAGPATADTSTVDATREGTIVGTHGFMPPEHAGISKEGTSTAADVYSLGAILYKMLTGKTLFEAGTLAEAIRLVRDCAPPPPRFVNPKVDGRLEAVCLKSLEKDPQNRYASAAALADDLDRWLAGEPPTAWRMPRWLRAWRAVRSHLLVGFLVMLTSVAAATVFFVRYYFDPERAPSELEAEAGSRRVDLIGDVGLPRWSHWNVGEDAAIVSKEKDAPFSITTLEEARLELLRKTPEAGYHFSAEVRHDLVYEQGWVGVYFAHAQSKTDRGVKNFWWDITFADLGRLSMRLDGPDRKRKYSEVALLPRVRYGLPEIISRRGTEASLRFVSVEESRIAPVWRQIGVRVTPEKVTLEWEGKAFHQLTPAATRKLGEEFRADGEVVLPEIAFDAEAGLGIIVNRGKASFRRVFVEPIR